MKPVNPPHGAPGRREASSRSDVTSPPGVFASAVAHYARYRSGYPSALVSQLAARARLGIRDRVVDIGCGTGQLTIPLARHVAGVLALDPEPEMLARGRAVAEAAGVANVTWVRGDSTRLRELVPHGARAATFAASFHWTDRAPVLRELNDVLAPDASVIVINDDLGEAEQPDWDRAISEVRGRYPDLVATPGTVSPMPESHREVLERSAFSEVQRSTWSWTRDLDIDEVIGLQLTYSFSTPARLGDRAEAFCNEIRDGVSQLHPGGIVTEPLRVEILTATRPGSSLQNP